MKEIKEILSHELGHLIINILLVQDFPEIRIKEMLISNYECENVKWCGWVKIEPKEKLKYEEVVKNSSLTAYKFFSLISGCFFQSLLGPKKINVNECFAFNKKALGKGDHDMFWEIPFKLRDVYKVNDDGKKAFYKNVNIIIFKKYFKQVSLLESFLNDLKIINSKLFVLIFKDYVNKGRPKTYRYSINDEYLNNLSKDLYTIMVKQNFKTIFKKLHAEMINNIEENVIKNNPISN